MLEKRHLIDCEQTKSPIAEAYRTLRTNIQFSKADSELKILLFTSSGPGEGKSTTVANTAVTLAYSGKQVIIVDCDLRKPVQHQIFGLQNIGVTNILADGQIISSLIQDTDVKNLRVLPSGPIPPNPSELLGSIKMQQMLNNLKVQADYLIIDSPPVVAVTDACVLASKMDGIILVLDSGVVRPEMAKRAKELLENAKGHILGVILNRIQIEDSYAQYYYYYDNNVEKRVSNKK
jgi:capsular exopolysaccharide synthesis family protein